MTKTILLLTAVTGLAFAAPALAADMTSETKTSSKVEKNADGSYTEKRSVSSSRDDTAGSASSETNVKEEVNSNGEGEKTVTKETVDDPKGLGNKTKTKTKDTTKRKGGQTEYSHKKTVNGKTVEENSEEAPNQ